MIQYKYKRGVSGGRDLVYKDMEGLCAEDVVFGGSTKYHTNICAAPYYIT